MTAPAAQPAPAPKPSPKPAPKPPPATQAKPPPPATQAQKQVAQPVQECPFKAAHPCDVDKLTVEVQTGSDPAKKLEVKWGRTNDPFKDVKNSGAVAALRAYDMVFDVLGDYPSRENGAPKGKVKISARAEWHGRKCAYQAHPLLIMHPGGEVAELPPAGLIVKGTEIPAKQFYAQPWKKDFGIASKGMGALFEIIKSFWPFTDPKLIEITAYSCGFRARGDGGQQRRKLLALVRIFRNDTYTIGIKLPPLGSYERERAGIITGDKKRTAKDEYSYGFGHGRGSTESTTKGGANYEYTETRWRGSQGTSTGVSSKSKDGQTTRELTQQQSGSQGTKTTDEGGHLRTEVEKELHKQGPIALIIKRNDRDFEKELFGGEKKSLKQMLLDGLSKGIEDLSKAIEMLNKVPQLGWKFTFSASLFAGEITVEVSRKALDKPLAEGRYYGLRWEVMGKISMDLISIEAALSFGIDMKAAGTGLIAKIEGKLALKVPVSAEFTLEERKPKVEVKLEPEASFKGTATAQASILGWSLIDAKISVKVAVTLDEGKLVIDANKGLTLKGVLKRKKIELTGHIKAPFMRAPEAIDPPKVLADEIIIHKFD